MILAAVIAESCGAAPAARKSDAPRRHATHTADMQLALLGWDRSLADAFAPWAAAGHRPARVAAADLGGFLVLAGSGELRARLTGRLRHLAGPCVAGPPAVGDWVCLPPAARGPGGRAGELTLIQAVLPRRTAVVRRVPGAAEEVLAANVDLVMVVAAPGREVDPAQVERLLAVACRSGARPVLVLAKADRCPDWGTDVATELRLLAALAPGVQAYAVSCWTGAGLDEVAALLRPGRTAVLLGPEGAGKSTLVNRLAGRDLLATGEARGHGSGAPARLGETGVPRTPPAAGGRQLVTLAGGALLIDTPGLRELGSGWAEAGTAAFDVPAAAERRR
jgi:ribosome biogenesis GTPase / thiamine phosphate phosphatase